MNDKTIAAQIAPFDPPKSDRLRAVRSLKALAAILNWGHVVRSNSTNIDDTMYSGDRRCPECGFGENNGHRSDCSLLESAIFLDTLIEAVGQLSQEQWEEVLLLIGWNKAEQAAMV